MFSYEVIQSLNSLELTLYEYIMTNSKKVIYMRIRELADEAHVSTTTIFRFCKKLNCEGFSEFKVKFKMCGYRALFRTCTKIGKVFEKEVYGSVYLVYDIVQFCEMILCLSK